MQRQAIANIVETALRNQPITDIHTHCFAPAFGATPDADGLLQWGIDELVTYHYLVAEVFRAAAANGQSGALTYDQFWRLPKPQQADYIWKHLFVETSPISEACRGVLTTLQLLGLDPNEPNLDGYRKWFSAQNADRYVDRVMEISNVDSLTMTNAVFDDAERGKWESNRSIGDDRRFEAVLRIDPLLRDWSGAAGKLHACGYDVKEDFSGETVDEVRRFLTEWLDRMKAIYVAMSLPPEFQYPDPGNPGGDRFIKDCLMPVCADRGLPWAMMIGSRLRVNPALDDAGDMVGKADIRSVVNLCCQFPKNKFLVTMLSRENQHELCVSARKFHNLMVFGCWWFLNNPSIVEEITRERLELLGTSFIPQHSDARILDQVVYKWHHNRKTIGKVLVDKYLDLSDTGFAVTEQQIKRDVAMLMRENFRRFVKR